MLRLGNMRGLDLTIFDVDYDLTWNALMLDANGKALGRFNQRGHDDKASLAGLSFALEQGLARFVRPVEVPKHRPERVEDYPLSRQFSPEACIHCHHVPEFRRAEKQKAGKWRRDDFWIFPEPANLGLVLEDARPNRILGVSPGALAEKAGLKAGDELQSIDQQSIASLADIRHALNAAPKEGTLVITWRRQGQERKAQIALPRDWKKTDVSWRWSLQSQRPGPQVQGDDLTSAEKKALGLPPRHLAFRLNSFLSRPAQQAGLKANDVIIGLDGVDLKMTARQFGAHVRMNYQVGDEVVYRVRRGEETLAIPLKLVD